MDGQASSSPQPDWLSNDHSNRRLNVANNSTGDDFDSLRARELYQILPPLTVIDTEVVDIQPFVNHFRTSPRDLPTLFYERYNEPNPWNLWAEDAGLQTTPNILGVPLDEHFFRDSITKHLSFPLHEPWLFSPYISVTRNPRHVNRSNPLSLYQFDTRHSVLAINLGREDARRNPWLYRITDLIVALGLPAAVYEHRPGWMDEYLVLQAIPREFISVYSPEEFEQAYVAIEP